MFTIKKEILPSHHAKLTVTFSPEAVERAKRKVAQKLSKQTRVPGFRPGKAPYGVVVRHFGEAVVREELLDTLLDTHYADILKQAEIEPAAPGKVLQVLAWEPEVVVELEVPLKPEVNLGDYRSLRVPYEPPQVNEEEIERALDNLRRMHVRMETVDRPAQKGDVVLMKLKGRYTPPAKGDEKPEPKHIPEEEISLLVKEDDDPEEWPFPGFSKQLEGLKKGDKRTLTYTYPEDAPNKGLRGYTFEYDVEVVEVQTPVYPELTDEFVREHTDHETLEELREAIRENLQQSRISEYDQQYLEKVIEGLVAQSQVKFPQHFLDTAVTQRLEETKAQLAEQGLTLEEYLEARGESLEAFLQSLKEEIKNELIRDLVLEELAHQEGIEISQEEFDETAKNVLAYLLSKHGREGASQAEIRRFLRRHQQEFQTTLENTLDWYLHQKTLAHLVRLAKGELEEQDEPEQGQETQEETPPEAVEEAAPEARKQPSSEKTEETPSEVPDSTMPAETPSPAQGGA